MARLPLPGADAGNWGDILNDYLRTEHQEDGHLKDGVVSSTKISPLAVNASHVADNAFPQTKIQNLTSDLSSKYSKPTTGIPITDLSQSVQDSLHLADTALQTAPSSSEQVISSGFPLRRPGEQSIAVPQELANAYANSSSPVGTKTIVLSESWGKPGVLKHIWVACGNTTSGSGFLEQGGIIRIYTDDATTPAVQMSLGDFFYLSNHSDIFSTPRVGRTNRGGGDQSAAYRYLHMPFQKYMRVEVENTTSSDTVFYGSADYSTLNSFSDLGNQQLSFTIKGQRNSSQPKQTPLVICDTSGAGQLESLYVSFSGADSNDSGILEGNIEIFIDGKSYSSWSSSGMEDAFNGGWYTIPVGGYPAGRAGNSDQTGANESMYRFFVDDPIFFSSHIKIVVWAGQPGQGSVTSSTVQLAGYAGLWFNSPITPNYLAPDSVTTILNDQMDQAAGPINASSWHQDGSRTQASATGSSFIVPYGNANADEDVRIARSGVSLPSDYWVETRMRITEPSANEQQAHLIMLGASPDPYFGSAVHVQLYRHQQTSWSINVRDDFSTSFVTQIGSGRDLTNVWVRVAMKKIGTKATAYYTFEDSDSIWLPLGTWTPTKTDVAFGIGTWTAGAEFDYLIVRPIAHITA